MADEPSRVLVAHAQDPAIMIYNIDNSPPKTPHKTILLFPERKTRDKYELVGTWKGMVALYQHSTNTVVLFNPDEETGSTCSVKLEVGLDPNWVDPRLDSEGYRKFRLGCCDDNLEVGLDPNLDFEGYRIFGLGYDDVKKCYKGVIMDSRVYDEVHLTAYVVTFNSSEEGGGHVQAQKKIYIKHFIDMQFKTGMVVNGVPYWVVRDRSGGRILYFDPKTDEFEDDVATPPHGTELMMLGTLGGELAATAQLEACRAGRIQVWLRKEDSSHNLIHWLPMLNIQSCPDRSLLSPVAWFEKGSVFLGKTSIGRLMRCDCEDGKVEELPYLPHKKCGKNKYGCESGCVIVVYSTTTDCPTLN